MTQSIEKHKVTVSIAVAVAVVLFLVGGAYRVGGEITSAKDRISILEKDSAICKKARSRQQDTTQELREAIVEMRGDVKHIKEAVDDLKFTRKSN